MKLVVMGAPGSGKGSQCPAITERYDICHLSTGDMLREAIKNKTANGMKAKDVMDQGKLVSNEIVFDIVQDAMSSEKCKKGWVLDGLPRTLEQAQMMDKLNFGVQRVIGLEVPDQVIVKRVCGRWMHVPSGRIYHTEFKPPKIPGKDDITGDALTQRSDDKKEIVEKRLKTFHEQTKPIYEYYREKRIFDLVDGNRSFQAVRDSILGLLDKYYKPSK